MATSAGVDALLLLVAMGLLAVVLLGVALERALQPVRPRLPAADLWLRSARSRP